MNVTFRNATPRDLALLPGMIQQLYASDAIPFDEAKSRRAILVLLSEPQHGNVRVMEVDQQPVGYLLSPSHLVSSSAAVTDSSTNSS